MERGSALRFVLYGVMALVMVLIFQKCEHKPAADLQPLRSEYAQSPAERAPEQICDLWGPRFRAQIGTHGASLVRFELLTAKYQKAGHYVDVATPSAEQRRQLRFRLRDAAAFSDAIGWQIDWDDADWQIVRADGKTCELVYTEPKARLTKTLSVGERPYEIDVKLRVENTASVTLRHAAAVETTAYRSHAEVESKIFRVSPYITQVECLSQGGSKALRKLHDDFAPKHFSEPEFALGPLNQGDWYQAPGTPAFAAVSNAYFAHALVPGAAPVAPVCQLQVEFNQQGGTEEGAFYRARLAYPPQDLAPGESREYSVATYVGPKERELLAAATGGGQLSELIDLGFFSAIAKVLVGFLLAVHRVVHNWGIAIMLLTLTARVVLFPLMIPGVKGMIQMRELKPELDAINAKFKDDAQARGLAQMELWRKHGMGPLGPMKGCLPSLAQMPVWFALYTTLQTAVELYNIPFLWFPDLSQADPLFILPFIISFTNFMQQKLMPMTGGDPAQQKMMLYLMPGMFFVFMLFLPAGLGVYMFTNGVLTIAQQQLVEWHVRRTTGLGRA